MSLISLWQLGGRRALDLTLRPSLYLDLSWKEKILPPMFQVNEVSSRAHRFVSRFVLSQTALAVAPSNTEADRLVLAILLLKAPRLQAFLLHFGALFVAQEVRQAIGKKEVEAYRQMLGDELYWFMLQRAPLFGSAAHVQSQSQSQRYGPDCIMAAVHGAGYAAMSHLCAEHQPGLWERVQLTLPDALKEEASTYSGSAELDRLRGMAMKILRELENTWASKFLTDNRFV